MSRLMMQADISLSCHVGDTRSGGSKHVVRMCFNLSPLHESLAALRKFVPFSCYSDANASLPRRVCDCDE